MRGSVHRHLAATVIALAMTGGAFAQSDVVPASHQDAPPTADAAVPLAAVPDTASRPGADALAPGLTGTDAAVASSLRDRVAAGLSRIERKHDRAAVEAFYRGRGFAPLWIEDGAASARAKAAAAFLSGVEADALDPADYPAPRFAASEPDKLAQDELGLTNSILAFARHARSGRVSFSRVSGAIYYSLEFPEPADVLAHMANAGDIYDALDSYHPQHAGYRALKAKLAEARGQGKNQAKNSSLVDTLIANMERWRWLPRELGKAHVTVNIPDFTLKVTDQGKTAWSTRIVVGKVGGQATPLLTETMKFITINPTWNVPPSIIRNEYLPALQRDPNALARVGLKVSHNKDGTIRIFQPPGDRNALGRIRFNFPNRFLVYQHDTPDKNLFAKQQRAYSHGCMRVQHPEKYAEVLLSITQPGDGISAERIRKMYGNTERTINLKTPIPVHLTYQTAFVDDVGQLQTRPDLYGHDREVLNLMRRGRGSEPIARNNSSSSRPVAARPPGRAELDAQDRRPALGRGSERIARRFDFGGSTFYSSPAPRRTSGVPY